jgi:hypothetical protein
MRLPYEDFQAVRQLIKDKRVIDSMTPEERKHYSGPDDRERRA